MSLGRNATRGGHELEKVLGAQLDNWKKDSNNVLVSNKTRVSERSSISFPGEVYLESKVDLNSFCVYCRAKLIISSLGKHKTKSIWEVGAGDGRVAIPLSKAGIEVIASEPHYAGAVTLAKNDVLVFHADLSELKLKIDSVSALGIFDVLEHIEDVSEFLSEIHKILQPGALLYITVPAHQWLFSNHDLALGHFRRHSRKSLIREFRDYGFKPVEVRYFFASLILPAFLLRRVPYLLRKKGLDQKSGGPMEHGEESLTPHPALS